MSQLSNELSFFQSPVFFPFVTLVRPFDATLCPDYYWKREVTTFFEINRCLQFLQEKCGGETANFQANKYRMVDTNLKNKCFEYEWRWEILCVFHNPIPLPNPCSCNCCCHLQTPRGFSNIWDRMGRLPLYLYFGKQILTVVLTVAKLMVRLVVWFIGLLLSIRIFQRTMFWRCSEKCLKFVILVVYFILFCSTTNQNVGNSG